MRMTPPRGRYSEDTRIRVDCGLVLARIGVVRLVRALRQTLTLTMIRRLTSLDLVDRSSV